MGAISGVPLLLSVAEVTNRTAQERVLQVQKLMDEHGGQTVFVNSLRHITVDTELSIVGIFSLFEARMQNHFARGPFFDKLKKQLIEAKQPDLANRIYHYYLAVNVLKHGRGRSYRELLAIPDLPFAIKKPDDSFFDEGDIAEPEGLVNVLDDGFFSGLINALDEAYQFLETR